MVVCSVVTASKAGRAAVPGAGVAAGSACAAGCAASVILASGWTVGRMAAVCGSPDGCVVAGFDLEPAVTALPAATMAMALQMTVLVGLVLGVRAPMMP